MSELKIKMQFLHWMADWRCAHFHSKHLVDERMDEWILIGWTHGKMVEHMDNRASGCVDQTIWSIWSNMWKIHCAQGGAWAFRLGCCVGRVCIEWLVLILKPSERFLSQTNKG